MHQIEAFFYLIGEFSGLALNRGRKNRGQYIHFAEVPVSEMDILSPVFTAPVLGLTGGLAQASFFEQGQHRANEPR